MEEIDLNSKNIEHLRDEKGRLLPNQPPLNPEGRPKDTPETKLIKKAAKQIIAEYKEALAEALPLIQPVLIAKALEGDISSIKEIHDRAMDKAKQPSEITGKDGGAIQVAISGMRIIKDGN